MKLLVKSAFLMIIVLDFRFAIYLDPYLVEYLFLINFSFKDKELEVFREEARNQSYLKEEVSLLKNEKETLNQRVVRLEQDLYGARLAAKYLDKELAGRY